MKVAEGKLYHVEKILAKHKQSRKTYLLVKWRNGPFKCDSWIEATELKNLTKTKQKNSTDNATEMGQPSEGSYVMLPSSPVLNHGRWL